MKIKETIGIDVSKLTLDVTIHSTKAHFKFKNSIEGFRSLVKWVETNSRFDQKVTLYVLEHTGLYSYLISVFFNKRNIS